MVSSVRMEQMMGGYFQGNKEVIFCGMDKEDFM